MMPRILGLDIGGANLKAATHDEQFIHSRFFPLWTESRHLAATLAAIIDKAKPDFVGITMTGELADCFESKQAGVRFICDQVVSAVGTHESIFFYRTDGKWSAADQCNHHWRTLAASNWHALASFAAAQTNHGYQLLIDVGSTTTDIIPLANGQPLSNLLEDVDRLKLGQLVYCGMERTPICALLSECKIDGEMIPLARELFATTLDAFLLTGDLQGNSHNLNTADGRPAILSCAHARLARSFCQCPGLWEEDQTRQIAMQVKQAVIALINEAINRVIQSMPEPPTHIMGTGAGVSLLPALELSLEIRQWLPKDLAPVAPAYAVAKCLEQYLNRTLA